MPRWTDIPGQEAVRLDGFEATPDGAPSDAEDRTFRLRFETRALEPGERALLAFDGIATVFDVSLNGALILSGSSMFRSHEVDVSELLLDGANELVIVCRALDPVLASIPRRPRQRW